MATGASMNMHKRRTGMRTTPQVRKPWEKGIDFLKGLSTRAQILLASGVFAMMLLTGVGVHSSASNAHVPLYPIPLSEQDVRDVSRALTAHGIEHTVTPQMDQVELHPSDRLEARAYLAERSLPRNRLPETEPGSSISRTRLEQLEAQRSQLENELAYTVGQMEEIDDARVQLAFPEKTYFLDDQKAVTASLFLKMHRGEELTREAANGIASLVAHSVPELHVENVSILDHRGRELRTKEEPETFYQEVQLEKERQLQDKLQAALGHIYGDRVHAVVNLTLDFSEEEQRRYTPGSPTDDGMVKDSIQLVHEMLEGASKDESKKYDQKKEAVNYKYMENYFAKLRRQAKIERVTATVLVDGAAQSEVPEIQNIVKGSIGIDEVGRGDEVYVSTLPWNHRVMGVWSKPVTPVPVPGGEQTSAPLELAVAGLGFVAIFGVAGFLLTRKYRPLLGVEMGGGGSNVHSIVDHNAAKDGTFIHYSDHTATNSSRVDALEKMVVAEPTKVADLLKTTWLSGN